MTISRSWTLIDESTEISEQDSAYLGALMAEWSAIQTEIEDERFRRQAAIEDGEDYDFEDEEGERDYRSRQNEVNMRRQAKLDIIESLLASHGARVMRPYEHWNEEERYMEYMENRYDY